MLCLKGIIYNYSFSNHLGKVQNMVFNFNYTYERLESDWRWVISIFLGYWKEKLIASDN